MKVLITGASGFIGSALATSLEGDGHEVVRLLRGSARDSRPSTWDVGAGWIHPNALDGTDAVVHLAGESIGGRWTRAKKREILESRVRGTSLMAESVAGADLAVFISSSAIGFYGDRGDEVLTESSARGSGFLSDVSVAWEQAAQPAIAAGVRTVLIRTGLVLDDGGGSLPRLLLPFKLGFGGRIGPGTQWWSWITLEDEVRAIRHLLDAEGIEGPVNLTAPEPARNEEFVRALAAALNRPAVLPTPSIALKSLLGAEFTEEVLLSSQRVEPRVLLESGFQFLHPRLERGIPVAVA